MYHFVIEKPGKITTQSFKFATEAEGVEFLEKYNLMHRLIDRFFWI